MHWKKVQHLNSAADTLGWTLWLVGLIALITSANLGLPREYGWISAGIALKGLTLANRQWLLEQYHNGFPFLHRGLLTWE